MLQMFPRGSQTGSCDDICQSIVSLISEARPVDVNNQGDVTRHTIQHLSLFFYEFTNIQMDSDKALSIRWLIANISLSEAGIRTQIVDTID